MPEPIEVSAAPSLRDIIDEHEKRYEQRFSDLATLINDLSVERDKRYAERFGAQEKALEAAFEAAQVALRTNQETVAAAFAAAKDAVEKAADATDRRFAAVTEKIDDIVTLVQLSQGRTTEGDRRQQVSLAMPAIVFGAIGTLLGIVGFIYALAR